MSVQLTHPGPDVAELLLDDGDNGNRLTTADIRHLAACLDELRERAPLITVMRQKGADFSLGRVPDPDENGDPAVYHLLSGCTTAWGALPGLTLAAATGRVEGFAAGFVAQADIGVVGESTTFRFPEIQHGFAPSIVIGWLTKRVSWQVLSRWTLTGCPLAAETALRTGLVGTVVPDADVAAELDGVIAELLKLDGPSLRECKRFARYVQGVPPEAAGAFAVDSLVRQHAERVRRTS
jgi:enoyl-CoA hydratase/carnithine racemase